MRNFEFKFGVSPYLWGRCDSGTQIVVVFWKWESVVPPSKYLTGTSGQQSGLQPPSVHTPSTHPTLELLCGPRPKCFRIISNQTSFHPF